MSSPAEAGQAGAPLPVEQLRFEVPSTGMTIAASAWGDPQATPVVFLHGGGQTRHAWGGSAETLARAGYRAIAMDHRGHGESTWDPAGGYENDDFRDDLLGVLEALGRPPVLVGASLGGITSLLAEAKDERSVCLGIVFVDVTPRLEPTGVRRIIDFMMAKTDGFESLEEVADAIAAYQPHRKRGRNLAGLEKNLRRGEDGRWYWHWDPKLLDQWDPKKWNPAFGEEVVARRLAAARTLTVPTLLVRGRMSAVVTEENVRAFLEAVPSAEYVDLEDAAHMVAGDRNDVFTDTVLDFIQRHFGVGR